MAASPASGSLEQGIGHYLRDLVYGANDGIITTLAVVAGVSGAALAPKVAVILGLANLLADGFSMGASNYLGMKSELERQRAKVDIQQPLSHGLATFLAFVVAGGVPLLGYALAPAWGTQPFPAALVVAGLTLATVGGARARFTDRGVVPSALEMVLIGGLAAAVAYAVGVGADALL